MTAPERIRLDRHPEKALARLSPSFRSIAMALLLGVGYGVYKIRPQVLLVAAAFLTGGLGYLLKFSWKDMESGIVEQHPQGHAGHPDHADRRHPHRLLDGERDHPHGHLLRPQAHLAEIFSGHGLPRLQRHGPRHGNVVGNDRDGRAWHSSGSPWGSAFRSGLAAGAIVSGAYFGDKMSPFSDIPNLAAVTAGANLFDHIKHMMWSAVPGWLLSLAVYFFVGLKYQARTIQSENDDFHPGHPQKEFPVQRLLLLPMLLVFYLAFTKRPTIPGMLHLVRRRGRPGRHFPKDAADRRSPRP